MPAFAADHPSVQIILSDDTKAETILWSHRQYSRTEAFRNWIARTTSHTTRHTDKSSEDGSVIAGKSFSWTQTPDHNTAGGPPDDNGRNDPDTEDSTNKSYLLNTAHLLHQLQKAQGQEDRNLICLQRTLEIIALAALLLFFL